MENRNWWVIPQTAARTIPKYEINDRIWAWIGGLRGFAVSVDLKTVNIPSFVHLRLSGELAFSSGHHAPD